MTDLRNRKKQRDTLTIVVCGSQGFERRSGIVAIGRVQRIVWVVKFTGLDGLSGSTYFQGRRITSKHYYTCGIAQRPSPKETKRES